MRTDVWTDVHKLFRYCARSPQRHVACRPPPATCSYRFPSSSKHAPLSVRRRRNRRRGRTRRRRFRRSPSPCVRSAHARWNSRTLPLTSVPTRPQHAHANRKPHVLPRESPTWAPRSREFVQTDSCTYTGRMVPAKHSNNPRGQKKEGRLYQIGMPRLRGWERG